MKTIHKYIITTIFLLGLALEGDSQSSSKWLDTGLRQIQSDQLDSATVSFKHAYQTDSLDLKILAVRCALKNEIYKDNMAAGDSLIEIGDSLTQNYIYDRANFLFDMAKAEFYKTKSKYDLALSVFKDCMSKAESLQDIDIEYAGGLQHFGLLYEQLSKFDSSAIYMEKAKDVFIKIQDSTSLEYAYLCNNLATTYLENSNMSGAQLYFEKALDIFQNQTEPVLGNIAMVQGNLAVIHSRNGDQKKAIYNTEKALEANSALGYQNGVAINYYNLGVYSYYNGDYGRTRSYIEQCIQIREKLFGNRHSSLIGPLELAAIALDESGRYKESRVYAQKAKIIIEENYSEPGIREAYNLENIALSFLKTGNQDSSLVYIDLANDILSQIIDPDHPNMMTHYFSLGRIHMENENYTIGRKWFNKAIAIMDNSGMKEDIVYAQVKVNLGRLDAQEGKWQAAEKAFDQALKIAGVDDKYDPLITDVDPDILEIFDFYMSFLFDRYKETTETKYLDLHERYSKLYLDISEKLRRKFYDPYTKSTLIKKQCPQFSEHKLEYMPVYSSRIKKKRYLGQSV